MGLRGRQVAVAVLALVAAAGAAATLVVGASTIPVVAATAVLVALAAAALAAVALNESPLAERLANLTLRDDLRNREEELDRTRAAFREAVGHLGDVLAATHDLGGIVEAVVETALLVVPATSAVFYELAGGPDHLVATTARGVAPGVTLDGSGLAGAAARHRSVVTTGPTESAFDIGESLDPHEPAASAAVAAPVQCRGRTIGVLAVYSAHAVRSFSDDEVGLLVSLLRQAEVAITNIELHEQARREALTDGVTGLWNRRQFDIRVREAVTASQRFGEPFGVALFDLDDFKRINDTYDHFTGDAALVHFAALLRRATRDVDVASRWGGEEFAVLVQRATPLEVEAIADRILDALRQTPLQRGELTIRFTSSAGVASFPWDGSTGAEVVNAADGALLRAKTSGKDRVERALPSPGVAGEGRDAAFAVPAPPSPA
jgi:two-component system cell cycle response regulator